MYAPVQAVDGLTRRDYADFSMTKSIVAILLLGGSLLGLSFALQAQDLPETPYDESQDLACEHVPVCPVQVIQDSLEKTESTPSPTGPLLSAFFTSTNEIRVESEVSDRTNFVSASIRAMHLRC
jgi:hypothetical protein